MKRRSARPTTSKCADDGLVTVKATSRGGRRSIYVLHRRTKLPTILESFDSPQMGPNCLERGESIVAPQALHLLNNAAVHELAGHFADRVLREAGAEPGAADRSRPSARAWASRPADDELTLARETLAAADSSSGWRTLGQRTQRGTRGARGEPCGTTATRS